MNRSEDGGAYLALADCLFNFAMMVVCLFALQMMLPQMKSEEEAKLAGIAPGKMCVEIHWQEGMDVDFDLWGRGPDKQIVGYSAKTSSQMDLLRDDLGMYEDPTPQNFEMICARAKVKGNYTFDVQWFGKRDTSVQEVPVTMVVRFPNDEGNSSKDEQPLKTTHTFTSYGQEVTMLDFYLDDKGRIIQESINSLYQPLRSVAQSRK